MGYLMAANNRQQAEPIAGLDYVSMLVLCLLQAFSYWGVSPLWLCVFVLSLAVLSWEAKFRLKGWLRFVLVVLGTAWFFLYYGKNLTVEMAASFLFLAASFKLTEIASRRDSLVFVYIMFYLSAVSLLFNQHIGHLLVQVIVVLLGLKVLLGLNGGQLQSLGAQWRSLLKLLMLALPLVLVLFLFFPRIAPLWTIPIKSHSATTGISDSMTPGDIAELSNSADRAFRVNFSAAVPAQSALYWRGLVLDYFDGTTWSRRQSPASSLRRGRYQLGEVYDTTADFYQVMLEPTNQAWAFTLNHSQPLSNNLRELDMGGFALSVEAIQPTRYRMGLSELAKGDNRLPTAVRLNDVARQHSSGLFDLQLPSTGNVRTRQWVAEQRAVAFSDLEFVQRVMRMFSQQSFSYTLKPTLLGDDSIDAFLFDSQRGFCAHYAGSLAYILRLAGIPARVVVGYQGGEYYAEGGYLIVRQYDAHAWVEAEVDGLGWVRLDPTAMVAPERVEQNLRQALAQDEPFLSADPLNAATNSFVGLKWLVLKADALNYQWQKWVVNYSQRDQYSLVSRLLGDYSLSRISLVMFMAFCLMSGVMVWIYWLSIGRRRLRPAERRYLRWLGVMSYFGYHRGQGETPRQFLQRVEQGNHPRLALLTRKRTKHLERQEYE